MHNPARSMCWFKVGCMQMCTRPEGNYNQHNNRVAAGCCPLVSCAHLADGPPYFHGHLRYTVRCCCNCHQHAQHHHKGRVVPCPLVLCLLMIGRVPVPARVYEIMVDSVCCTMVVPFW
jgi:hypothetical protein